MAVVDLRVRAAAERERRRRRRARWAADPVAYARERLGLHLTPDQEAVLRSVRDNRRTFVKAANGVGKTFVASVVVCWFMECLDNAIAYTTAPSFKQVTDLLWKEIRTRHADAVPPMPGTLLPREPRWDLSHDSFAVGRTADSEEGFKGQHAENLLVVLDEGPGVPPYIYSAAFSMLKGSGARFLTIGNPTVSAGPFFDAFHNRAAINHTITISAATHPNVTAALAELGITWDEFETAPYGTITLPTDWTDPYPGAVSLVDLDDAKVEWGVGTPLWSAAVLGDFPDASDTAVIPLSALQTARTGGAPSPLTVLPKHLPGLAGKWAGLDVARFGGDRSVLVRMDGPRIESVDVWQGMELSHTAGKAAAAIADGYTVNIDVGGLGAGISSHLKDHGYREGRHFHEVNAGSAPQPDVKDRYTLMRDQLWFDLADYLRAGTLDTSSVDEQAWRTITAEASAVEYRFDSRGRRKVESKDDLKKRIGRSPDLADAVCLAVHRPKRKSKGLVAFS